MNRDFLIKYMNRQCSEKELNELQAWLREDPANESCFSSFIESWEEEAPEALDEAQKAWRQFRREHLHGSEGSKLHRIGNDYRRRRASSSGSRQKWVLLVSTAAAVLLAVFATAFMVNRYGLLSSAKTAKKITYRTVVTKKGERTQFHLKDGTQVKLNAASKLRIPDNYGKAGRKVYLQGEAFFKVVHNEKKPFKVISGGIVAKDVGTAFDVANYDSSNIKIAVKEGAVSVGKVMKHNGKPLQVMGELRKNDLGVFDSAGKFSVSAISGESPYWGWTEGKLIFRDAPFPEVVKRLERWFNIDGKIKGAALRKRTLTAAYDDLSLKSVLNVLSYSLHISCARQGDTIVFKEKALSQE